MSQPKVIAYCPLHYGAEYLDAAIRSVDPFVDRIHIYYTDIPSYGFYAPVVCPETEEQLKAIALNASTKVHWYRIRARTEADHRNIIFGDCQNMGYDLVLTFDADEIIEERDLQQALDAAYRSPYRFLGINGYVNFWRSFERACFDSFRPVRIINLHNAEGQGEVQCRIYHFSCAQSATIMHYKYEVHGHHAELRPGWLENVYFNWKETDTNLHPVAHGIWNAVPFDKTTLPEILQRHPNFNKARI